MKKIKEYFINLRPSSFTKSVGLFFVFSLLVLPVMFYWMIEITTTSLSPDTLMGFDIGVYYNIRETYGVLGRKLYIVQRYTFDLIWPIVYTVFLLAMIGRFRKRFNINNWLFIIPLIAVLFDFLENIFATIFMVLYPKSVDILLYALMVFTNLKWLLLLIVSVVLIVEFVIILISKKKI